MSLSFYLWFILLAAMLFIPVSNLIWVVSVRRLQRKLGTTLDSKAVHGQKVRARFISLFLVALFSWFFNLWLSSANHG
ncbi:MAG: hypothetical protein OQL20_09100 [Sedimenticola sp.]|nr:hypothetical protein [Sedimenticola sp.]